MTMFFSSQLQLTDEDALPELSAAVAGTILSLMANFWFTCTQIDSMKYINLLHFKHFPKTSTLFCELHYEFSL